MKDIFAAKVENEVREDNFSKLSSKNSKNLLELGKELEAIENRLVKIFSSQEEHVKVVCEHLLKAEGKRLRPILVCLSGQFGSYDFDKIVTLGTAVEVLHMATLIHDDIIDQADLRRGIPTINKVWDQDVAILMGDYFYGKTLVLLGSLGKKVIMGFSKIVTKLVEGEMEQKLNRFNPEISLQDYHERIHKKTAFFISQCCSLSALVCGGSQELVEVLARYGNCLGIAFQIQDDLMDFTEEKTSFGKPVQEDLKKGILTLPVIYALAKSKRQQELRLILKDREISQEGWRLILEEIKNTEAINYGKKLARYYARKARATIEALPAGPSKESLEFLTYFVTERKK